jgi:hypothetical protein
MLGHYKVSGKPAGANATLVGGPDWDTEHEFDGDATGGLLVRDSTQPFGATWVTAAATGRVLVSAGVGVKPAWSAAPSLTSLTLSTPLAAGSGGTGLASYAIGDLLYASGAAALSKLADVATGQVLVSGGVGVAPAWSAAPSLTSLTLSTPLAGGSGGTGISSYAVGDLLYASGAAALSKLADVAAGSVLVSGGVTTAPAWSATPSLTSLTLSTPLAGGSGGTGISSYAVGDLLYASGAAALSKLADVATGSVLVSGGVTTAPAWSASPTVTKVLLGNGTLSLPSLAFAANVDTGLYNLGPGQVGVTVAGVAQAGFFSDMFQVRSATTIAWSSGNVNSSTDTSLGRGGAAGKVVLVGTTPMFMLGGITSASPAIKASSAVLQARLADDSAFADVSAAIITAAAGTATPAAGSTAARLLFGTTAGFGIYYGSNAPTVSAAQGSLYLRSDGSSGSTRLYVNTNGTTGWTNVTTAT